MRKKVYMKKFITMITVLSMISVWFPSPAFAFARKEKETIHILNDPAEVVEFLYENRDDENLFHHLLIDTSSGEVSVDGEETSLKEQFNITKKEEESLTGGTQKENRESLHHFIEEQGVYAAQESEDVIDVISPYQMRRIIVKAGHGVGDSISTFGAQKAVYYTGQDAYILQYEDELKTKEAYEQLEKNYGDENVILDLYLATKDDDQPGPSQQTKSPDDYTSQAAAYTSGVCWGTSVMGLNKIKKAANQNSSLQNVIVAVLDTGIDTSHEMFDERTILSGSKSFVTSGALPRLGSGLPYEDDEGHGTHVAGIITDATPVNMQLLILKVLDSDGSGSTENIALAIDYAVQMKADVINMSLGCDWADYLGYGRDSEVYENIALEEATLLAAKNAGSVVCAASGNGDQYGRGRDIGSSLTYPASSDHVIAIGSMDKSFNKAGTSNYGEALDFIAPGVNVKSAAYGNDHGYVNKSGTSMAAPAISAAAAYVKLYHPSYQFDQVYKELKSLALDLGNPGFDSYYGWGYVKFSASYDETWDGSDDDDEDPAQDPGDDPGDDNEDTGSDIWNTIGRLPSPVPGGGDDSPGSGGSEPGSGTGGDTTEPDKSGNGSSSPTDSDGNQTSSKTRLSQTIALSRRSYKKSYKADLFYLDARANTKLTFSSSNPSVATVSNGGWVRTKSPGNATIKVTAVQDSNYKAASTTVHLIVQPAKVSVKKVQVKNRNLNLVWKKDAKADGYIVRYGTKKNMKDSKEANITGSKSTKKVLKKLKKHTTYYVQVCSYTFDAQGELILGEWSTRKKCKTK